MFWHKNIVFLKKNKNNKIILLLNKILDVFYRKEFIYIKIL